jgi:uncharacterized SAM-dependent methyltransferase
VRWPGGERRFAAGERIHTEHSHKFRIDAFEALLHAAGYGQVSHWSDTARWFAVFWAQA